MIQGFKDAMDRADERHAKMGRPTKRTPERVAHILDRLSKGFFLTDICREARLTDPEFPVPRSVDEWTVGDPELTSAIAHAREAGAQTHIEQCLKIADHGFGDYVHTPFGVQFNAAAVARSKLQIETRIRYAEKIAPKRFGPKVELASNPDNPISGDRAKPLSEYPEDALMIAFEAARTRRLTDERTIEGDATDVTPKKARAK